MKLVQQLLKALYFILPASYGKKEHPDCENDEGRNERVFLLRKRNGAGKKEK